MRPVSAPHHLNPHERSPASAAGYVARAATVLLAAALVSITAQAPASAHSQLTSSDPAAGAALDRVPSEISLVFNEEVEPQFAAVTIAVAGGDPVQVPNEVLGSRVVVDVPEASVGSSPSGRAAGWQVAYRVVSADGHPISGTVDFTVTAPAPGTAATTAAPTSGDPTPSGEQPTIADPGQADAGPPVAAREPATSDTGSEGLSLGQLLGIMALTLAALGGAVWLVARVRSGRTS